MQAGDVACGEARPLAAQNRERTTRGVCDLHRDMLKSARHRGSGQELNQGIRKLKVTAPRLVGVARDRGAPGCVRPRPPDGPARTRRRHQPRRAGARSSPRSAASRARSTASSPRDQTTEVLSLLHAGAAGAHQPGHLRAGAVAGREVGVEPDGRTHTLHLRPGVTWSDGTPFTADDVLFSLQAVYDPKVGERPGRQPDGGRPAAPRRRARRAHRRPDLPGAVGPRPAAARQAADPAEAQARSRARRRARSRRPGTRSTPPAEIVGTGPFVLREYQPGQRVVLDRNPRYWRKAADGAALPYLDRLVLRDRPRPERGAAAPAVGRHRPDAERAAAGRLRAGAPGRRRGHADADRARRRPRCRRALVLPEARGEEARTRASRSCSGRSSARRISHAVDREAFARDGVPGRGRAGLGTDHARQHALVLARRAALSARRRHGARAAARASASRIATATAWSRTRRAPRRASP